MVHLFIKFLFVFAGFKWGNWKEWQRYYSTILFFIMGDLFYNLLFYLYPMWSFQERIPIFHYEFFIVLSFMLLRYPATVLIYLGRFPAEKFKALLWIILWVLIYLGIEKFDLYIGLITHHNGWHLGWSFIFNIGLFVLVKIHYHRPLLAWGLSFVWIIFLWNALEVPIDILK